MLLVSLLMLSDTATSNFRKVGETLCVHEEQEQSLMNNWRTINKRVRNLLLLVGDDAQAWLSMSFSGGAFCVQDSGWHSEYREH